MSDQPDPEAELAASEEAARYNRIQALRRLAAQTFTPTRPVQLREIFAGRADQLFDCTSIAEQLGLHGILYGDRGVGKTSIANMVRLMLDQEDGGPIVAKIECVTQDTFGGIVRQIYQNIPISVLAPACGFGVEDGVRETALDSLLSDKTSFNPKDVASVLRQINRQIVVILDEFDRLDHDNFDLSSFTELIKISSDTNLDLHFLIVGVGESVSDVIGNHASIVRNLTQIKLGSMTDDEIRQIIRAGMQKLQLKMPDALSSEIISFSCGYPHYTHLLCLDASLNAISYERTAIERADLDFAISRALNKAQESVKNAYHDATRANRQNIYKEVLHACGEAHLDEYNTFAPKDVERHLSARLKRPMKATQFGAHLINLCKPERGAILMPIGERGRARYRFKDPLMRAYVRLAVGPRRNPAND